jgi:uncharacterized membrane protein YhaH (DUF805 family)
MFKDCFGFEGRIRRLEYGLTYIIVVVGINLIFVFGGFLGKFSNLFLSSHLFLWQFSEWLKQPRDAMIWVILAGFSLFHFTLSG